MSEKKKPDDDEDLEDEETEESDEDEEDEEEDDSDEEGSDEEEEEEEDEEDEEEEEEDDEDDEEEDAKPSVEASPEAIARRVAALGADDEIERLAREEEEKLRARKKKGAKRGLQAAASRRLKKIAARAPKARRPVSSAIEAADPLLERTAKLGEWVRKNEKVAYIAGAIVAVGLAIFGSVTYLDKKKANEASSALASAVADERGRIGDPDETNDDPDKPKDLTPVFKTAADRREAALVKYRAVMAKYAGTGAATLARLAEGSLLLDKRDPDGAASAFTEVKSSPLAQADAEVKGRALEGLGFAYELKAVTDAPQKEKHLGDAIKEFKELENTDVSGFKELGMYHQGRVYEAKGEKDKAIEELKSLHERLNTPGNNHAMRYLEEVGDERLRALDPTAIPPKQAGQLGGGPGGGNTMTQQQIEALMKQLQGGKGGKGMGHP